MERRSNKNIAVMLLKLLTKIIINRGKIIYQVPLLYLPASLASWSYIFLCQKSYKHIFIYVSIEISGMEGRFKYNVDGTWYPDHSVSAGCMWRPRPSSTWIMISKWNQARAKTGARTCVTTALQPISLFRPQTVAKKSSLTQFRYMLRLASMRF